MLTSSFDPSAQHASFRPPLALVHPGVHRPEQRGGLAERQLLTPDRGATEKRSRLLALESGPTGRARTGTNIVQPQLTAGYPSQLTRVVPVVSRADRSELLRPQSDALLFAMAVRNLLESERTSAARALLEAAPAHVINDPLMMQLRSALAPPVVTVLTKTDEDRAADYDWLRTRSGRYRGQWVALARGRLIAAAPRLRELRHWLKAHPPPHPPLLHRVE